MYISAVVRSISRISVVQLQLKGVCPYQQIHREYTHSLLVWANTYANSEFRFPIRPAALLACCLANVSQFNTNSGIYSSNFDLTSTLSRCHSLPVGRCYSNCCRSFPGHCWGQGYCWCGSCSSGRGLTILSCSVYSIFFHKYQHIGLSITKKAVL